MRLPPILRKIHEKVTEKMSQSHFVETVLIATVTEDDGMQYDCIYCTILRNAVLFGGIGAILGFLLGVLICQST